jgi:hypothetical protein
VIEITTLRYSASCIVKEIAFCITFENHPIHIFIEKKSLARDCQNELKQGLNPKEPELFGQLNTREGWNQPILENMV